MYPGRVVCCPLLSHVKYEPRALLRLAKEMEQTDGRTDAGSLHYAYRYRRGKHDKLITGLEQINLPLTLMGY